MTTVISALPALPRSASVAEPIAAAGHGPQRAVPHIPSLDGLRAVSFLIVFWAHAGLPFVLKIPGGFGVTVFFFLSGFLITTLIRIESQSTGTVSIRNFYLRRALRILPPFYIVLALSVLLTQAGVLEGSLDGKALFAQAAHFANYWFIFEGTDGVPAGTVPYWSLAVEEHFYLVFPLLYLLLNRYMRRERLGATLWLLCAVVCAWRCLLVFGYGMWEDRTYMGSDTRFDSILFGCALAVSLNPMLDRPVGSAALWKWGLLPAGLGLLLVGFTYRAPWFRETFRYTIQGLGLVPVFVTAIRYPEWLPFRLLNVKWVAFVGTLSYTLYLSHQVALMGVHTWLPDAGIFTASFLALALSLVLSLVLYQFVEKPCAQLRKRLAPYGPAARATASS
jgi:peptidoglycan/LPS O-acetylase OafA/YrhL